MDLTPYLSAVADDLQRATALADEHTREVSTRVATAIEPALRLALLQALSDAAAEITAELPDAAVVVRMEGRDPVLDVQHLPGSAGPCAEPGVAAPDEDEDTARVTVRLPASLKQRAEARALEADQSLNTWIVQSIRRGLSTPTPPTPFGPRSHRVSGWA